jgi:hypothetical protein
MTFVNCSNYVYLMKNTTLTPYFAFLLFVDWFHFCNFELGKRAMYKTWLC